jgi:hypothetical protein
MWSSFASRILGSPTQRSGTSLNFGEPELLKQSALAHYAQLNAYLERNRKARAMKTGEPGARRGKPIIAAFEH